MRMSRRAATLSGGMVVPSLSELWSAATLLGTTGTAGSSESARTGVSIGSTSSAQWLFVSKGTSFSFAKVKNNVVTILKEGKRTNSDVQIGITINSGSTASATKIDLGNLYGYVLARFSFSSYNENAIDAALSRMSTSVKAYRYSSSASTAYGNSSSFTTDADHFYISAVTNGTTPCFSLSRGNALPTSGSTAANAMISSNVIAFMRYYNSRYYLSANGTSNLSTRVGGILELS